MTRPLALRPGDLLAVVSPASRVLKSQLEAGIGLLEGRGYRVRFGRRCFESDGPFAGTDQQRAADLRDAWFDPEIRAVICSRGGYGCARLLPLLDFDAMAANPKLLIGFSDATTLHLALNRRGLATLHAPMPYSFSKPRAPWVIELLFDAMEGRAPIRLPDEAPRAQTLNPGIAEGEVTGGCLCLLCDSIGTPDAFDPSDKIVLIEDVDEAPHRVDAMLTHLLNAGLLQKAAGIVVGEMTRTDEKTNEGIGGRPWREVVSERLGCLRIPAVIGFPFGHHEHMASLPLGVRARLDAGAGELAYLELGVDQR